MISSFRSPSTFSKKLFLGIGFLVVLTFSLGVTVLISFSSISDGVRIIVHTNAQREALAATIGTETAELLAANRGILFRGYMHDLAGVQQDNQKFEATASQLQQDQRRDGQQTQCPNGDGHAIGSPHRFKSR